MKRWNVRLPPAPVCWPTMTGVVAWLVFVCQPPGSSMSKRMFVWLSIADNKHHHGVDAVQPHARGGRRRYRCDLRRVPDTPWARPDDGILRPPGCDRRSFPQLISSLPPCTVVGGAWPVRSVYMRAYQLMANFANRPPCSRRTRCRYRLLLMNSSGEVDDKTVPRPMTVSVSFITVLFHPSSANGTFGVCPAAKSMSPP